MYETPIRRSTGGWRNKTENPVSAVPPPGAAHPAPVGATIYYWHCGLLLLAPTLVLDRPTSPLSVTLRIACREPYTIEVEGRTLTTRASLVGSKAGRRRITAINSDIALFYLSPERPEYAALLDVLGGEPMVDLDVERFAPILPTLRSAFDGSLGGAAVKTLVHDAVRALTGVDAPPKPPLDLRIGKACEILDQLSLSEVNLEALAQQVHLSPSRLRDLFKQQTGSTVGDYARWQAVWRAVFLWKQGRKLTDVAVEAGFYDLAHADRTFVEVFGMNPSTAIDPRFVRIVNCD